MFCLKCGEAIPDNSRICPKCGAELITNESDNDQAVVYASQNAEMSDVTENTQKKTRKKLIVSCVAAICVIAIFFIVRETGKANLRKDLVKEWCATSDSIIKVLDISEDEIEYRLETGYRWMDTTLGTYEWKVVSRNKIEMKHSGGSSETYTIELNEDKDVLRISPAVTSTDSSETWFYID